MSTKKILKTGAIFEIELDRGIGYGYVKLLISHDIDSIKTFNLFIVKPYNVFSDKQIKRTFDPKQFETDDILCFPLLLYFPPKLKGTDSWRFVGMSELTKEDLVIPDYVSVTPPYLGERQLKESFDHYGCIYYLDGLKRTWRQSKSFESIKHLGIWPTTGSSSINRFLSMSWRKQNGDDPFEFYRQYMNGKYDSKPEFELISGGIDLINRDNTSFRKMERVKRLKYIDK